MARINLRARLSSFGHFKRGFAYTFALDVTSRIASTVGVVILIRQLPTDAYAYVVVFLAVGQFLGSSATGGIRMLYLRNEAERISRGTDEAISGFGSCALTQTVMVVAVALLGLTIAATAGIGASGDRLSLAGTAALFAFGMSATELAIARKQAHLRFASAGSIAVARSGLLLVVALFTYLGVRSGPIIALYSAVAVAILGLAVTTVAAWREAAPVRLHFRTWVFGHETGWLTVYYVGSASFATIDVFLIAALLGPSDVASYGAAQRYQAVVLGALPALIAVFRVRTSQLDVVDSPGAQRRILMDWIRRLTVPALVSVALIAIAAPFLVPLANGGRYPDAVPIFELLMVAAIATYLVTPAPSLLMAQRRFRLLAGLLGITVLANAVADVLMAKTVGIFGLVGVAVAIDLVLSFAMARLALHLPVWPGRLRQRERSLPL